MKTKRWFEAVGVVSRNEDGSLKEWYSGDKFKSYTDAKAEAIKDAEAAAVMGPGVVQEYCVIEVSQTERFDTRKTT